MRDFNYELKELCRRNRDGSYATQANRERILDQMASLLASDFNGCFAAVNLKRLSSASCPKRK